MAPQGDRLGRPELPSAENGEVGVQMGAAVPLRANCRKDQLHLRRTGNHPPVDSLGDLSEPTIEPDRSGW